MLTTLMRRIRADDGLTQLLKQSSVLYVTGLFSLALTFIQQLTTAHWLGAATYGQFAVVLSSGLLMMLLVDFRTWEVATKFMARPIAEGDQHESVRVMSWLALLDVVAGGVGMLLTIALAAPIARYLLQAPELDTLVAVYAISVPFRIAALGVLGILPRLYDRFAWVGLKSVVYALIRLVLISGAALAGFGLQGVVLAAVIGEILNLTMLTLMAWRIRRQHFHTAPLFDLTRPANFADARRLLGEMWMVATIGGLHYQTFVPILALLTTPAQVGLFRTGMDIAELLEKTIQPLTVVFSPRIIALHEQEKHADFRRYVRQVAVLMLAITLLLLVGLLIGAWVVIPVVLNQSDYAGLPLVATILLIGIGIHTALQWWIRPTMVALGRVRWLYINMLVLIVCSLPALVLLVPANGAVGSMMVSGAIGGAIVKSIFMGGYALISLGLLGMALTSARL